MGKVLCLLTAATLLACPFPAFGSENGQWALGEDGKRWSYYYAPGRIAEDEWIETDGKIYYVDSNGYMKTGWVVNRDDGERYYLGEDGAMCFNTFASDGRYVGPDGTGIPAYDTYRSQVKRQIQQARKEWTEAAAFLLADLDQDDFPDLVIADQSGTAGQPLMAALWDEENASFAQAALFDGAGFGQERHLFLNGSGPASLEICWPQGDIQVFTAEDGRMECQWSLTTRQDKWGSVTYLLGGEAARKNEWEEIRLSVLAESAEMTPASYLSMDDETVSQTVDVILSPEEALKWDELG